jgi:hypothetical protein
MKTAISIPDPIFAAAEGLADRLALSRSELYARAVAAFVAAHQDDAVRQQLDDIYGEERARVDTVLAKMQSLSIGDEAW